ncbi:MAG: MFS transporter [Planctomycetaceae bacterium]|nr:MFS transporter [Planctomycetaceae bacterium]
MKTNKARLFVTDDGKNVMFTFILVSSLFLLWGTCNGMIDTMDKHFQEELNLTLAQSANVQWAHYLGYFLMSIPAGWLASRIGYKGGIIVGLLMVAAGGLWFIPATHIAQFWAFLVGVCFIASGLTFLETIANPYTTVLGSPCYAATRINLAQSCNSVGWAFGPFIGMVFFYSKDAAGQSTGSQTLWIPYAVIAAVVTLLAIVFYFAHVPDIKAEDDYHLDDAAPGVSRSIWSHPHFVAGIAAQFFYVAAQAGIFSFFINYMTAEVPPVPISWLSIAPAGSIEANTTFSKNHIKELPSFVQKLKQKSDPVSAFIADQLSDDSHKVLTSHKPGDDATTLRIALVQDLNKIVRQNPNKTIAEGPRKGQKVAVIGDVSLFAGVRLSADTQKLLAQRMAEKQADEAAANPHAQGKQAEPDPKSTARVNLAILNRKLLHDAYPQSLPFDESVHCISNSYASLLTAVGFVLFLLGRYTGASLLKRYSAHKILGLYGVLNVIACLLVVAKLGWASAVCVFLSYFFMSIMFPTIFALGIFGLGDRAKKASAFIVMAIMGGAIVPKLMGAVADQYDMSRGFLVPMVCFALVALYGVAWPMLSNANSLSGVKPSAAH